jgi:hypothetical protein
MNESTAGNTVTQLKALPQDRERERKRKGGRRE